MSAPGLRRIGEMSALTVLALAGLLIQLAPLGPLPDAPIPDLFWAVLAFFALRRPAAAPVPLIFALVLLRDGLLGGPPGAGALSLLLGAQALRMRAAAMPPPRSRLGDWTAAALVYAAALMVQWLMMVLSLAHPPGLPALILHALSTAAALPLVWGVLRYVLRLGAGPAEARRAGGLS
ncbi:MAG: hypothetical protein ACQEUZ_01790 [Pseudomonadota bacterium]